MDISRTVLVESRSAGGPHTALLSAAVLSLACLWNGCSHGVMAGKYQPALGPRGVTLVMTVGQRQFAGELVEVRESGLVILVGGSAMPSASSTPADGASSQAHAQGSLQFVAYGDIRSSRTVDQTGSSPAVMDRRAPDPDVREQLRLLSRFPQGLTAELLQLLLSAHGQSDLPRVAP
jgi:hypothetical protein